MTQLIKPQQPKITREIKPEFTKRNREIGPVNIYKRTFKSPLSTTVKRIMPMRPVSDKPNIYKRTTEAVNRPKGF